MNYFFNIRFSLPKGVFDLSAASFGSSDSCLEDALATFEINLLVVGTNLKIKYIKLSVKIKC